MTYNPWFDDAYLLRFCRARKFQIDAIIVMFENFIKWREENGIDTILSEWVYEEEEQVL